MQNHKDNHKNSMAGTTVIINVKKGDEVFCKKKFKLEKKLFEFSLVTVYYRVAILVINRLNEPK